MTKNKISFLLFMLIYHTFYVESFAQASYSYLALGDSYTIGESVEEDKRWPIQLVRQLNRQQHHFEEPTIIAKTGWRTDELINAITEKQNLEQYHVVSIQIGVNNQYQNKPIEEFKKDLNLLLPMAISLSKNGPEGVFALSIPDYGVTPFAKEKNPDQISKEIQLFNSVYKEACESYDIAFYNITPISKNAAKQANLLAKDGLHPSGLMYKEWVDFLLDKKLLNLQSTKKH